MYKAIIMLIILSGVGQASQSKGGSLPFQGTLIDAGLSGMRV